jgi:carbon-monoxide dehydrogenase medium subunit
MTMGLPPFQYLAPKSTEELIGLLATHGDKARILAGGTDLINWMAEKIFCPDFVIDVNGLPGIADISYEAGKGLTIGAAVKIEAIDKSDIIREKYFSLHAAAAQIGSPQVRAMATIGGNCCNASPCADMPPPLVTFDASVKLVSHRGRREMSLEQFILGNRETAIEPDELLESIFVAEPWPHSASRYATVGLREAQEIDIASVAVNVGLDPKSGKISDLRIAMGAVAPIAMRARKAEEILKGREPNDDVLNRAAESCGKECQPIDDLRASASYRRYVVQTLAGRTLREALAALG